MSEDDPEFSDGDEPGARKSFWEHVQDLRVAVIRSAIAIGAAVMVCLLISPQISNILQYPLRRMHMFEKPRSSVTLELGERTFGPYDMSPEQFATLPPGTPPQAIFRLGTKVIDGETVLTVKPDPRATAASAASDVHLLNFSPTESFMVAFHVGVYAGIVISAPFWIYFLGSFIVPAFKRKERTAIFSWVGWGAFLGLFGILMTFFFLLPLALRASVKYSELMGFEAFEWKGDDYVNFTCKFMLGMGIGFQFPLVVLFLVKLGLVTRQQLSHYRRHVIVISLILGAVLTTPEPVTQVAMAVPLYLLYEICIWIAWYWDWKKRKAA